MRKLKHPSHAAIAKRLKRAAGHLQATLAMIDARRPSLELAQQLAAVEAAIRAARQLVAHDQLEACLDSSDVERGALRHLKRIAHYL